MPFRHRIHYGDYMPDHLVPSESEVKALGENGVGPLKGDALKMIRKVFQGFKDRRYLVGHIFYTSNLMEWHFFQFDQRDIDEGESNHWKEGSHVHLVNWVLRPKYDAQSLWSEFTSGKVKLGGSIHMRFVSG